MFLTNENCKKISPFFLFFERVTNSCRGPLLELVVAYLNAISEHAAKAWWIDAYTDRMQLCIHDLQQVLQQSRAGNTAPLWFQTL